MPEAAAAIGHNRPPITPPDDTDVLADLRGRYPAVETELKDLTEAYATFPARIETDEAAKTLQDWLKSAKSKKAAWSSWRSLEKKPWDGLAKIVQNFFADPESKAKTMIDDATLRWEAWGEVKKQRAQAEAEAKAKAEREEADRLRRESEEAQRKREEAERAEAEAREREAEAQRRAEAAKREEEEAKARVAAAKAEEERLAKEKRERENAERAQNKADLADLKKLASEAQRLAEVARSPDLAKSTDRDGSRLRELLSQDGPIATVGRRLLRSHLLEDVQSAIVTETRRDLETWRDELAQRDEAAARERERLRLEEEEAARKAEADRLARIKADEDAKAKAKSEREAAEAAAAKAKQDGREARTEAREARADQREARTDQTEAERAGRVMGNLADKTEARADRIERKLDDATDADLSRTRSDLGTVGSLARRWKHAIIDEEALRKVCGPLGPYLLEDALSGAVYRWMQAHRAGFTGDIVKPPELPGVLFENTPEARIA